jgi:hypothetical protein
MLPQCCRNAAAMLPQNPHGTDPAPAQSTGQVQVVQNTGLEYTDIQGKLVAIPARSVVEIRMPEDSNGSPRFELSYQNGDYSLIQTQAMHLLRSGREPMDVRFFRSTQAQMRLPKL